MVENRNFQRDEIDLDMSEMNRKLGMRFSRMSSENKMLNGQSGKHKTGKGFNH